jgi:hypothetical protein
VNSADLRYPQSDVGGGLCCAPASGVVLCGAPLLLLEVNYWLAAILLAGFATLSPSVLMRTALRHQHALRARARLAAAPTGPGGTVVEWSAAGQDEAQLLLDQARPVGRLDAARRGFDGRQDGEGRFLAGGLSRYRGAGGSCSRGSDGRGAERCDSREFAVDGDRGGGSGRDRYEGSAACRGPDRRIRRPRRRAASRRQGFLRRSRLAVPWRWWANPVPASRSAARRSWACCRARRRIAVGLDPVPGPTRQGQGVVDIAQASTAPGRRCGASAAARSRSSSRSR